MDHLPPVSNPYDPVEVPFLGGEYDGREFQGYPARQSLDLEKLQQGDCQGQSTANIARFLQTWLYFGMLCSVLGIDIPTADFIQEGDSQKRFVTTKNLRKCLQEWKLKIDEEKESTSDHMLIPRNQQALACLTHSYSFWFSLDEEQRNRYVGPEIALSIHILASALEHALTSICDIPVTEVPWRLSSNPFLTQRMLNHGWCPSVVEQICTKNHLAFQYYASLLAPPSNSEQHARCRAGDPGCKAKNGVNTDYTTKHHEAGCKCEFLAPDFDALRDIVRDLKIPLIHVEQQGSEIRLKIVAFEKGMHYTALSHVWSDGLGNPTDNALPKCQILHINKLVSELPQFNAYSSEDVEVDDRVWRDFLPYKKLEETAQSPLPSKRPMYFWLDTLCVPLTPKSHRTTAIKAMRTIYSRATRVLVLDAALMQAPMSSCSEEKLSLITCSTWIRRLWTLQEAALARSNYFQFATESVIITDDEAPAPGETPYARWYDNEVGYYAHLFTFSWWKIAPGFPDRFSRIYFVFQALKNRSTSHVEDEPICLATLLDLDLGKLLDVPESQRMQKLWTLCEELPAAILFLPGRKLTDEGFGWAPASCMDCINIGVPMNVPTTMTPRGLNVTLHGLRLLGKPPATTTAVIVCELQGETYYIRQNLKLGNPSWAGLDLQECGGLAAILGQAPTGQLGVRPGLVACVGALVRVVREEKTEGEEGEILVVEYVRMVSVIGKDCRFDRSANPPWSAREVKEKEGEVVKAEVTRVEQKWCVGSLFKREAGQG